MADTSKDSTKTAQQATKTKGKKVHVVLLLDESGSMSGLEEFVVNGVSEFMAAFKDTKKARLWIASFDRHPGQPMVRVPVQRAKVEDAKFELGDYAPRGMTPLYDSILDVLGRLDGAVKDGEGVFMAIITDGAENASEAKAPAVEAALKAREERGWTFVYLGANQNARVSASAMGLRAQGMSFNTSASPAGIGTQMKSASGFAQNYAGYVGELDDLPAAAAANLADRKVAADKTGGVIGEDEAVELTKTKTPAS